MDSSAHYLATRAVMNRVDPVGLPDLGCPDDEYDPEFRDVIKWRTAVTAEQSSSVFLRRVGKGAMPSDMPARIADGIKAARVLAPADVVAGFSASDVASARDKRPRHCVVAGLAEG